MVWHFCLGVAGLGAEAGLEQATGAGDLMVGAGWVGTPVLEGLTTTTGMAAKQRWTKGYQGENLKRMIKIHLEDLIQGLAKSIYTATSFHI